MRVAVRKNNFEGEVLEFTKIFKNSSIHWMNIKGAFFNLLPKKNRESILGPIIRVLESSGVTYYLENLSLSKLNGKNLDFIRNMTQFICIK